MSASLIWSDKMSIGCSGEAYFGSLPNQNAAMLVTSVVYKGQNLWRIMFNDSSDRKPLVEHHATRDEAMAHADLCLLQPISARGYRSLAFAACTHIAPMCTHGDSQEDIQAAAELAGNAYPAARPADIAFLLQRRFSSGACA